MSMYKVDHRSRSAQPDFGEYDYTEVTDEITEPGEEGTMNGNESDDGLDVDDIKSRTSAGGAAVRAAKRS
jgi:hypothetical protein